MGWTFRIQAGLLGIPVKIDAAAREERVSLKMVAPDGGGVKQKLTSEKTGKEVARSECGRGVEVGGELQAIDPEELAAPTKRSDKVIHLSEFVPEASVDAIYLESSYYAKPEDATAETAYALLFQALRDRKVMGVGRATFSGREHYVLIRAGASGLQLFKIFYSEELRKEREYRPDLSRVTDQQRAMASSFVDAMTSTAFDASKFRDEHTLALKALVATKREQAAGKLSAQSAEAIAPVADMIQLLQMSVANALAGKQAGVHRVSLEVAKAEQKVDLDAYIAEMEAA